MPFEAKITRARWVLGPFTSEDMQAIGNVLVDNISARSLKAVNVTSCGESAQARTGGAVIPITSWRAASMPFRDWIWTGRTMRSLKVKSASENRCVIGFVDPNADASRT